MDYECKLIIEDEEYTKTATVAPGKSASVNFGQISVEGEPQKIERTKEYDEPEILDPEYLDDLSCELNEGEDHSRHDAPGCLPPIYKDPIILDPIQHGSEDPEDPGSILYGKYTPARP